ncbi:hypothetical protein AVEN_223976-1 [Araneus ventricosus]|uniref:Uncharacterized protein n=1 Tax=Araneus ventricosus TaxID=182803 RepID=A0A4Y2GGV2_ARAVE|nr:hypothetical protein AVEN_223976-1 [Araneus ventricosus]
MGQVVHKKLSYVNFSGMVSETVCAEMLSRTCCSNLVGEVVHKKLSYVNLAAMVSETVCTEILLRTAYVNLSTTIFAIWEACHVKLIANYSKTEYEDNLRFESPTYRFLNLSS